MGNARIIRFLCLTCKKEIKGSLSRTDMVSCICGNIHIGNPDTLIVLDWEKVRIRHSKKWWNVNEL